MSAPPEAAIDGVGDVVGDKRFLIGDTIHNTNALVQDARTTLHELRGPARVLLYVGIAGFAALALNQFSQFLTRPPASGGSSGGRAGS